MVTSALLVLAAATEGETAHDLTPFYVAGGVLVAFALLVSAIGIARAETFPPSRGARAAVIALAAVLVAAAMAAAAMTG
jgi:hypothetical protein